MRTVHHQKRPKLKYEVIESEILNTIDDEIVVKNNVEENFETTDEKNFETTDEKIVVKCEIPDEILEEPYIHGDPLSAIKLKMNVNLVSRKN